MNPLFDSVCFNLHLWRRAIWLVLLLVRSGWTRLVTTAPRLTDQRLKTLRRSAAGGTMIKQCGFWISLHHSLFVYMCVSVVWGGVQRKQPAPGSAAGHSEGHQSDPTGAGESHTGDLFLSVGTRTLTCLSAAAVVVMTVVVQQRQERFSDCSALLELERKVSCWRLFLGWISPACSFTAATPAVWHLFYFFSPTTQTTSSLVFSLNYLWCFFFSLSTSLPPSPFTIFFLLLLLFLHPGHFQDRWMLERRMAELEEELKVRVVGGCFRCFVVTTDT